MARTTSSLAPTPRQLEIHGFMRRYQAEHGMPPTYREIRGEFGFTSTNTVECHLQALKSKGLVRHRKGTARAWLALETFSEPAKAVGG